MHEIRAIMIDDSVAWAFVCQFVCPSVTRVTVLTYLPDGATSMRPSLRHCRHLVIVLAQKLLEILHFYKSAVYLQAEWMNA